MVSADSQGRPASRGPGETGIVLSRYRSIAGYDWIAIPLIPYLYAVEKQEDIPLFADKKLVSTRPLMKAPLREELKSGVARKTAHSAEC